MFDTTVIIGMAIWGALDYFIAHAVASKHKDFNINPILYSLGGMALGGIYPLIFLGIKYLLWNNKQKKNQELNAELKRLEEKVKELEENKNN